MKNRICPECGVEFAPRTKTQVCCCAEHQRRRNKRMSARSQRRRLKFHGDAMLAATPVSNSFIMSARRKPKGVSDVRWRIELRRRQNPGYYALLNEL